MNAVVTYIFGGNEKLRDPVVVSPNTAYYVITDDNHLHSHIWTPIVIPRKHAFEVRDQVAAVKFNPFVIPANKYLIIDASHQITHDVSPIFHRITDTTMCVKRHPKYVDVKTEIQRWKKSRNLSQVHEKHIYDFIEHAGKDILNLPIYEGCFIGISNSVAHQRVFWNTLNCLVAFRDNNMWFPSNQIILSIMEQISTDIQLRTVDTKLYADRYKHNTWHMVKE